MLRLTHPDYPDEVWTDAPGAHAPEDRVGGPFAITLVVDDGAAGDPWHLVGEDTGYSYRWAAVRAPGICAALDALGDHGWFVVDECDVPDYEEGDLHYSGSGAPMCLDGFTSRDIPWIAEYSGDEDED